ncbi:hypothetical protein [Borborobacter arsenicus]|uniref:hypothetical protein n=1 Tax=Borborobacter arsenicus TaxID=1851146 RepID=UPI0026A3F1BA
MTLGDVVDAQKAWSKNHGSSAAGRYQFMRATLQDLSRELNLLGNQIFDADLQDRLAYHLLKRRGYEAFMAGKISRTEFGKRLAQEWASLPVLAATMGAHRKLERGDSYYRGDGINKVLTTPAKVEAALDRVRAAASTPASVPAQSKPASHPPFGGSPAQVPAPESKARASGSILAAFALIAVAVVLFIVFGS